MGWTRGPDGKHGRRRSAFAVLVGVVLASLFPSTARADELSEFEEARQAYRERDYERAATLFESRIGSTIRNELLLTESRRYLGAAYYYLGRRDEAERQFRVVLDEDSNARLDPQDFPRELQDFFQAVRADIEEERRDAEADAARDERERRRMRQRSQAALDALADLARVDEVDVPHDPLLAWVPFGVGQYQNGNEGLGTFFLVTEVVLAATSIVSAIGWLSVFLDDELNNGRIVPTPANNNLRSIFVATNWASFGLAVAFGLTGILEANLSFVPSHRERRENELPDQLVPQIQLGVGPMGLSLHGRF